MKIITTTTNNSNHDNKCQYNDNNKNWYVYWYREA